MVMDLHGYYRVAARFGILASVFALAACAEPAALVYTPPPGLTAQTGATVIGSQLKTSMLRSNISFVLAQVDNKDTQLTKSGWKTPTLVPPGLHVLNLVSCECGGLTTQMGNVSLPVDLVAGKTYIIEGTIPSFAIMLDPGIGQIWLADTSGNKLTPVTDVAMQVPQQPVFVPVFIPAK
jgi:hypothetical protein